MSNSVQLTVVSTISIFEIANHKTTSLPLAPFFLQRTCCLLHWRLGHNTNMYIQETKTMADQHLPNQKPPLSRSNGLTSCCKVPQNLLILSNSHELVSNHPIFRNHVELFFAICWQYTPQKCNITIENHLLYPLVN